MRPKIFFSLVLQVVIAAQFALVGSAVAEDFKIGFVIPLSGPLAEYGMAIKNGADFALSDLSDGGSCVKPIFEDSGYNPQRSITATRKLKTLDKADAVYVFGGPPSAAVAPVSESLRLPTFVWTLDGQVVKGSDFVVRFTTRAEAFGALVTADLHKRGLNRLAVVKTDNQYLDLLLEGLQNTLHEGQEIVVVDTFAPGVTDFRTTISKIRSAQSFDAIGVLLLSGQVSQFYIQLAQQKMKMPTFGADFFESETEIKNSGDGISGAVFANHVVNSDFKNRYRTTHGNDYQLPFSALSYDLVQVVHSLFCNSDVHRSPNAIMEAIKAPRTWRGQSGEFRYKAGADGDSYFEFPVELRVVSDGRVEAKE